ncbi:hypothetical protein BKA70DRAFT_1267994 [Coprinopsis sp. MPI-PUGE-AT-0042]|nr:hypothetical protein BKA70DRAFT_1267994 [Coprinopsis sp. MPI-PUGE-AT-0042]
MDGSTLEKKSHRHPIHSIPVEILEEIFIAACPVVDVRDPKGFIGRLGRVCFRWWTVALECPELWCNLNLSFGQHSYTQTDQLLLRSVTRPIDGDYHPFLDNLIDNCARRSKLLPLSIDFHPIACHCYRPISSAIARLLVHSHRWAHVTLDKAGVVRLSGQMPSIQQSFPALKSLRLSNPSLFRLSQKPVNLRRLFITNFDLVTTSDLNIPWEQLTELSLELKSHDIQHLSSVWQAVHRLKTLSISIHASLAHTQSLALAFFHSTSSRSTLPSLHCLTVTAAHGGRLDTLLDTIRAPALVSLCLRPNHGIVELRQPKLDIRSVDEFLERSGCTLKRLQLVDLNIEDTLSMLNLANVVTVQHLHLQNIEPLYRVLNALRRRYMDGEVYQCMPYLETMTISGMAWFKVEEVVELIVEFLHSRLKFGGLHDEDSSGTAYLSRMFVRDVWIIRQLVQRLQEVLPPGIFRWDFSEHDSGRPSLVSLTFDNH